MPYLSVNSNPKKQTVAVQPGHPDYPTPRGSRSAHRSHRILRTRRSKLRRLARYIYIRFIRLQSHPQAIAKGLAAGVFAGSYPLFGLQTFMGVAIAAAIGGNKIIAAAGTWISNPLTYIPIYAFNYQIGRWLLGQSANTSLTNQSPQEWMSLGFDITIALMVGSTLVGIISAIISYYIGLHVAHKARKIKSNRQNTRPKDTRNRTHI